MKTYRVNLTDKPRDYVFDFYQDQSRATSPFFVSKGNRRCRRDSVYGKRNDREETTCGDSKTETACAAARIVIRTERATVIAMSHPV